MDDLDSLAKDITEQLGDDTDYIKFDYPEGEFILSLIERVRKAEGRLEVLDDIPANYLSPAAVSRIRELEEERDMLVEALRVCLADLIRFA